MQLSSVHALTQMAYSTGKLQMFVQVFISTLKTAGTHFAPRLGSVIESAAEACGAHRDEINYEFGRFFLTWCRMSGYEKARDRSCACTDIDMSGSQRYLMHDHSSPVFVVGRCFNLSGAISSTSLGQATSDL